MTLTEYRKELKHLGYKLYTKKMSWGRHATYLHVESGDMLTYNVFTKNTLVRWRPLFDFINQHTADLIALAKTEGITALIR